MKAKKLLFLPLLGLSMVFFVQCTEDPFYSETDDPAEISALKKGKGGGGHPEVFTNNLSFPAIAVDGFSIPLPFEPIFDVPYTGDYPGLSPEQIAALGDVTWYAQKTEGNLWQADWMSTDGVTVTFIDWGDVIESVNPKLRRPFRLEVTLYKNLTGAMEHDPMDAFRMALLEYPSSLNEVQGTDGNTYKQQYATVVSNEPKLLVQYLGNLDHDGLEWDEDYSRWEFEDGVGGVTVPDVVPVTFSTELNVGGKYIYGASKGGWKPDQTGYFRITFYVPAGSGITFGGDTEIGNAADFITTFKGSALSMAESDEGGAATPEVVPEFNLTYVDVLVVAGGGGGKKRR